LLCEENGGKFETLPLYWYQPVPEDDPVKQGWIEAVFLKHQLFFRSRRLFNDPFDCVVPSLLSLPGTVLKRYLVDWVNQKFAAAPDEEKAAKIAILMSTGSLEGVRRDLQNNIDSAGILCLSRVRDDILMWAHYADKHRGICLEFDGSDLDGSGLEFSASANRDFFFFAEAQEVKYCGYTPLPLGDPVEQVGRVILTKSRHWSYEHEYRIFRPNQACVELNFRPEFLTGVIFGCKMPEELRQRVREWATAGGCHQVAFFEARPKTNNFGLDIFRT